MDFVVFVLIIILLFLAINLVLAPHVPYPEKKSIFECGYHSFFDQNRLAVNAAFAVFAILFLVFDMEIILIMPFIVSIKNIKSYGIAVGEGFIIGVTVGFFYEIGKGALNIESKQQMLKKFVVSFIISTANLNNQSPRSSS